MSRDNGSCEVTMACVTVNGLCHGEWLVSQSKARVKGSCDVITAMADG